MNPATPTSSRLPLSMQNSPIIFITIIVNKSKLSQIESPGPFLDKKKLDKLPDAFGPGPINRVVRESVQNIVDASLNQKEVRKVKLKYSCQKK